MEEIHITFNVDIYLVRPFVVHKDCVIKIDHFPSNIKAIKLDLSIIDEDNMRVLVSIIKKSPNLTHIDLARNTISNKAVELIVNDLNEHPNLKVLKISGVSDNILFEHPDKMLINETSIDPDLDTSITIELSFMNMRRSVERMGKLQKEITEEYSKQKF
ncbi:hypothetical protein C2G38_2139689 [Gigaspora rosea]|uniref:Uncharacterized protein n=1 Tax=Gigaspora rosea TaxID=44941 RepID=A0A397VNP2_9GLOM|nr:hypothetical protein C2G38_2139689 [Gigaspora rosea]